MTLRPIDHDTEFEPRPAVDDMSWESRTAGELVGSSFGAFLKILHPMYKDPDVTDTDLTWEDADTGPDEAPQTPTEERLAEILEGSTLSRVSGGAPEHAPRILWSQLAAYCGITLDATASWVTFDRVFKSRWPRFVIAATEDEMPEDQAAIVFDAVRELDLGGEAVFRWGFLAAFGTNPSISDDATAYRGTDDDWRDAWSLSRAGPSHSYVTDYRWCLATPYDLDFSVLGGPAPLVERIAGHPEIEGMAVNASDRIV